METQCIVYRIAINRITSILWFWMSLLLLSTTVITLWLKAAHPLGSRELRLNDVWLLAVFFVNSHLMRSAYEKNIIALYDNRIQLRNVLRKTIEIDWSDDVQFLHVKRKLYEVRSGKKRNRLDGSGFGLENWSDLLLRLQERLGPPVELTSHTPSVEPT